MSQKVHVKSLRVQQWGGNEGSWFSEKYYGSFWGSRFSYLFGSYKLLAKGLTLKVSKAPTKRRLRKPVFMYSSVPLKFVGKKVVVSPLLSVFPRKGLSAKYMPYRVVKGKTWKSFGIKKKF